MSSILGIKIFLKRLTSSDVIILRNINVRYAISELFRIVNTGRMELRRFCVKKSGV